MSWSNPPRVRGRYINPHRKDLKRTLWDFMLWRLGFYDEPQPRTPPPEHFIYPAELPDFDRNLPSAVWLGHSTYLIQIADLAFLTDPVFSQYCSPIPIKPLARTHEPPLSLFELPPLDFILLSHNHYDHLDEPSVLELNKRFPHLTWIVPSGVKEWFERRGFTNVVELAWGESCELPQCRVTAVPSQHFSGRSLWDKNRTLWCGYIVECEGKTLYFVGDTGYNSVDFKQIGQRWPSIDLSLIPIGAYVPEKFMQPVHISPREAVEIHCDVGSKLSLGMHWKTFHLSDEPADLPPYELFQSMEAKGLDCRAFIPIEPGQHVNW